MSLKSVYRNERLFLPCDSYGVCQVYPFLTALPPHHPLRDYVIYECSLSCFAF